LIFLQTKKIETTLEALASDDNSSLPPLMNPTMLEASDDLTNLSHLNEPAGMLYTSREVLVDGILMEAYSPASYQAPVFPKGNIHV
jgi:myosin V